MEIGSNACSLTLCCFNLLLFALYHRTYRTISGGGARERVFWKNYFFHCAFTRYEAGLSIDEIWSHMPDEVRQSPVTTAAQTVAAVAAAPPCAPVVAAVVVEEDAAEETITFDGDDGATDAGGGGETEQEEASALFGKGEANTATPADAASRPTTKRAESDYEMVGDDSTGVDVDDANTGDDASPQEDADYELDELEAEIARELED